MKIYPGYEPFYPNDKKFDPLYDLCEKYDLPLMIHTGEIFKKGVGSEPPNCSRAVGISFRLNTK